MLANEGPTTLGCSALDTVTGGGRLVDVFAPMLRRAVTSGEGFWRFEPNLLGRALRIDAKQLSRVPPKLNLRWSWNPRWRDYTDALYRPPE